MEEMWEKLETARPPATQDLEGILAEVVKTTGVGRGEVLGPTRARRAARARDLFYLRAREEVGATAAHLGRLTGRSHAAVLKALKRSGRDGQTGSR